MGLFDIFTQPQVAKQQPTAPAQNNTPTNPGSIPDQPVSNTGTSSTTAPNGVVPSGGAAADDSPLANFKDLWETKPTDPNAPTANSIKELKAEDVQKIVAKASFTGAVTPEMLSAIAEGGEPAQAAFAQAMNAVAQQVMVQGTLVSDKMIQQKIKEALDAQTATLPELLRKQAATDHANTTNPIFSNPAVKPIIESTRSQLMQKFPNASPAEITKMTQDYIIAMGQEFSPKPAPSASDGGTDWEAFLQAP